MTSKPGCVLGLDASDDGSALALKNSSTEDTTIEVTEMKKEPDEQKSFCVLTLIYHAAEELGVATYMAAKVRRTGVHAIVIHADDLRGLLRFVDDSTKARGSLKGEPRARAMTSAELDRALSAVRWPRSSRKAPRNIVN